MPRVLRTAGRPATRTSSCAPLRPLEFTRLVPRLARHARWPATRRKDDRAELLVAPTPLHSGAAVLPDELAVLDAHAAHGLPVRRDDGLTVDQVFDGPESH